MTASDQLGGHVDCQQCWCAPFKVDLGLSCSLWDFPSLHNCTLAGVAGVAVMLLSMYLSSWLSLGLLAVLYTSFA
jgi:hypothetical protein